MNGGRRWDVGLHTWYIVHVQAGHNAQLFVIILGEAPFRTCERKTKRGALELTRIHTAI